MYGLLLLVTGTAMARATSYASTQHMPILSSARVTASSQPTLPSTQEAGTSAPIHHHGKLLLVTGMVMARQISYASAQHTLILSSARATASSQPTLPSTQEVGTSVPI